MTTSYLSHYSVTTIIVQDSGHTYSIEVTRNQRARYFFPLLGSTTEVREGRDYKPLIYLLFTCGFSIKSFTEGRHMETWFPEDRHVDPVTTEYPRITHAE